MSENQPETPNEPMSVYAVLAVMLDQMAGVAWQKMGLQPDPFTGTMVKDSAQARVAIDVVESLAKSLDPELGEEDKRQIQNLLRDLRVNFVEQSK